MPYGICLGDISARAGNADHGYGDHSAGIVYGAPQEDFRLAVPGLGNQHTEYQDSAPQDAVSNSYIRHEGMDSMVDKSIGLSDPSTNFSMTPGK